MAAKNGKSEDRTPTRRMVLAKAQVLVVPDGVDPEKLDAAQTALRASGEARKQGVRAAWIECGEFTGSKVHAVEQYAGKPGTPDAKVGEFKAPPASGFHGAVITERP